jgi:hypothetical protein
MGFTEDELARVGKETAALQVGVKKGKSFPLQARGSQRVSES